MKLLQRIKKQREQKEGFTLVELIVVLVILAILAALLVPALTGYIEKSKKDQVIAETRSILSAVQTEVATMYATDEWNSLDSRAIIASKDGTDEHNSLSAQKETLISRYDDIVSLSEVPSLQDNGKGRFTCIVNQEGKVHLIIYDSGRGYTGLYFAETPEYLAVTSPDTNHFFENYNCKVMVSNLGKYETEIYVWSRANILAGLGHYELI